jgi:hypothetical protein
MGSRRVSSAVLPICNTPPSGRLPPCQQRYTLPYPLERPNGEDPSPWATLPPRASAATLPCWILTTTRLPAAPRAGGNSHNRGEKPHPSRASLQQLALFSRVNWRPSYRPWLMPGLRPGRLVGRLRSLVSSICSNTTDDLARAVDHGEEQWHPVGEGSPRPRSCFLVPAAFRARQQDLEICALVRSFGLAVGANSGH